MLNDQRGQSNRTGARVVAGDGEDVSKASEKTKRLLYRFNPEGKSAVIIEVIRLRGVRAGRSESNLKSFLRADEP